MRERWGMHVYIYVYVRALERVRKRENTCSSRIVLSVKGICACLISVGDCDETTYFSS